MTVLFWSYTSKTVIIFTFSTQPMQFLQAAIIGRDKQNGDLPNQEKSQYGTVIWKNGSLLCRAKSNRRQVSIKGLHIHLGQELHVRNCGNES